MKLIYIAGQYRGLSPERTALNIEAARHMGALVAELGHFPVIPHSNTAGFEDLVPYDHQFWLDGTMALMKRCDAAIFIQGWMTSEGAVEEHWQAKEMGLPIYYSIQEVSDEHID